MGWWIALGILILLAAMPMGVRLRYDADGILACVLIGPLRITVFPLPSWMKGKSGKKKRAVEKKQKPEQPPTPKPEKQGGSWTRFLPLVKTGLDFLGAFRRKLRVNHLRFKLILAGGDPSDLAVNYGRTWAAVGNIMPQLERIFVIRERQIEVECDFAAEETLVTFGMDITITLGRILRLLVVYGYRILKEFLKLKKNKAVQENESEAS